MNISNEIYRILTIDNKLQKFYYRKSRIPKGKSKYREIYIANDEYHNLLTSYFPFLSELLIKNDHYKVNHSFLNDRNSATNAAKHIGKSYCLSFDIKNFFDNIKKEHLSWIIDEEILDILLIDGSPRQGLPTSPVLSNIAFIRIDQEICESLKQYDVIYTRYADDLYFSFNDINLKKVITRKIRNIIKKYSFELNERKTTFQKLSNGNLIITGISVSERGIRRTRNTFKRIRAAKHRLTQIENNSSEFNYQKQVIKGLIEWSKCKFPKKKSL